MMAIEFKGKIIEVNDHIVVRLPEELNEGLPSKGMVMVEGTIDGHEFTLPLEPDGFFGHWLELNQDLVDQLEDKELYSFSINPIEDWKAPLIPKDILDEIESEGVSLEWDDVTVKAKWDWIRWIRFTKNPETRARRIDIMCSKLKNGDKRPCCFDRTRCTITEVSKSGKLDINL